MALHNDVFKQQIWGLFCDDLEPCLVAAQIAQFFPQNNILKSDLTFTTALAVFSVIEFAAGFYAGKDPTTNTVTEFLGKYFTPHFRAFGDKPLAKKFYRVFRNALSHQWSPKAAGFAIDFRRDWALRVAEGRQDSERIPVLNIPSFFQITKNLLRDFKADRDKNRQRKRR